MYDPTYLLRYERRTQTSLHTGVSTCVCVFIYISKCQDMCFVEDIKVKGQLLVHTKFSSHPTLGATAAGEPGKELQRP